MSLVLVIRQILVLPLQFFLLFLASFVISFSIFVFLSCMRVSLPFSLSLCLSVSLCVSLSLSVSLCLSLFLSVSLSLSPSLSHSLSLSLSLFVTLVFTCSILSKVFRLCLWQPTRRGCAAKQMLRVQRNLMFLQGTVVLPRRFLVYIFMNYLCLVPKDYPTNTGYCGIAPHERLS